MGSRKAEQAEEGGRDTPSGRQGGGSVMSLEPVPFACGQPGRGSLVSSGATDRRKTLLVCMYASGGVGRQQERGGTDGRPSGFPGKLTGLTCLLESLGSVWAGWREERCSSREHGALVQCMIGAS